MVNMCRTARSGLNYKLHAVIEPNGSSFQLLLGEDCAISALHIGTLCVFGSTPEATIFHCEIFNTLRS